MCPSSDECEIVRCSAALIVQHLYHNKYLTTINFIEEALPFSDIIPTATIGGMPMSGQSFWLYGLPRVDFGNTTLCVLHLSTWLSHQTYASAGWLMEYTRSGKKAQREGKNTTWWPANKLS